MVAYERQDIILKGIKLQQLEEKNPVKTEYTLSFIFSFIFYYNAMFVLRRCFELLLYSIFFLLFYTSPHFRFLGTSLPSPMAF